MKKSFILYIDSLEVLDELSTEQIAELFLAIKDYQNGVEPKLTGLMKVVFLTFKNQFKRDDEKWEQIKIGRSKAGKKGGLANASKTKQMLANASKTKQSVANLAVNVNVNDNVNDNDNVNVNDNVNNIIDFSLIIIEPNLKIEYKKFQDYWEERLIKGKNKGQPRWKGQDAFEIKKRWATWLGNQKEWRKDKSPPESKPKFHID